MSAILSVWRYDSNIVLSELRVQISLPAHSVISVLSLRWIGTEMNIVVRSHTFKSTKESLQLKVKI